MCQVSAYVKEGDKEELLKENVTKLEVVAAGLRVSTLFEGAAELTGVTLEQVDFSAGKIILKRN